MLLSILDTGTSNITSVARSVQKIGIDPFISSDIDQCIMQSNKLILPGIGNMNTLMSVNDELKIKLQKFLEVKNNYLLGICLGAQVMMNFSEESQSNSMGLIDGSVKNIYDKYKVNLNVGFKKIKFKDNLVKNTLLENLFYKISNDSEYYFLHKFYIEVSDKEAISCESNLENQNLTAIVIKKNIIAAQFHPELSKENGLHFLKNFSNI